MNIVSPPINLFNRNKGAGMFILIGGASFFISIEWVLCNDGLNYTDKFKKTVYQRI